MYFDSSVKFILSAQVVVGGYDADSGYLSSVELFPRPSSDNCFIPNLPTPRTLHSLSVLSDGKLVICGGKENIYDTLDSCIVWAAGNMSWALLLNMRYMLTNYTLSYSCI